jgi:hypothetical protein
MSTFLGLFAAPSTSSATRTSRPWLEALEDRLVPAGGLSLTTLGAEGTIGGAIFQQGSAQPGGSHDFDAFVQLRDHHRSTQDQGYNTDARPVQFDASSSHRVTHSIRLSDVPLVNVKGVNYRVFQLDFSAKSPLLSLDQLQIFLGNTGNLTGYSGGQLAGLNPVYNMNATGANWVVLSTRLGHHHSGQMLLYVPDSLFVGTAGDPYVYLYSQFGVHDGARGATEQWGVQDVNAHRHNDPPAPPPSSLSGTVLDTSSSPSGTPLVGVTMQLTGVTAAGQQVTVLATTNSAGFYAFDGLAAGTYTITEFMPTGYQAGNDIVGSLGGKANLTQTTGIQVGVGVNGVNYSFTNSLVSNVFVGS